MIYTVTLNPAIDRELLVPKFEFDAVLRASKWKVDFGGKGFNVSRLLVGFNTQSIALGFVGGNSGMLMEGGLNELGIQTDFVWVDGETRTNVSIRSESEDHYLKVNEPGPTITQKDVKSLLAKIENLAKPGDWWVLSGSLPPGCPANIYKEIITLVQVKDSKAVLDASGEALKLGCEASPYICKPNLEEAQALTGIKTPFEMEVAEATRKIGPINVIVSLGRGGAVYCGADECFYTQAPEVDELNPIGAGDSMVGGIIWSLAQNLDFHQAVSWGVACGAATASLEGTSVARIQDAKNLLDQVLIKQGKKA